MRKLLLLAMLYTGVAQAQLDHVSLGYGTMNFPMIGERSETPGGVAYLSIGKENIGGTLFIGGDSRITYGGERWGSGMVGLAGFRELEIKNSGIKIGAVLGIVGFQTYRQARGLALNDNRRIPQLKATNIQPYGALRLVIGFVEVQYAPVSDMLTVGIKLYKH